MEKLLIVLVFSIIFLCGCNKTDYEISNIKPKVNVESEMFNYFSNMATGSIKNISNEECKTVQITIEFKNGNITEEGWIFTPSPKIGEILSFDEKVLGATKINNWEDYEIKVKDISCDETF